MKTYRLLSWAGIAVEIDIDMERSVSNTRGFAAPGREGFVFAAGEVWLRDENGRHLISGEFNTGNALGVLGRIKDALRLPLEWPYRFQAISNVGPCRWMLGYWARINEEKTSSQDEEIYDLISPSCVVADGNGCVAVYKRGSETVVQACAEQSTQTAPICYEHQVDASVLASRISELSAEIRTDISFRLTAH